MEIQDIDHLLALPKMLEDISDYEIITIATQEGANQMTCVKLLRRLRGYSLPEADKIVSSSSEWEKYSIGNQEIKRLFFDSSDRESSSGKGI